MNEKNAASSAFPLSVSGDMGVYSSQDFEGGLGLTKREEFAKAAMVGLLPMAHNGTIERSVNIAQMAVQQADALLAELEK